MPGRLKSPSPAAGTPPPTFSSSPPPSPSPLQTLPTTTATTTTTESPAPPGRPDRAHQTLIRNRRLHWLSENPAYFDSPELELADPLLYDRLIRQYQSAAEREAQGRARGWSGVLEADLTRAEAKVAALAADGSSASGCGGDSGGGGGGGRVPVEWRAETSSGEAVATRAEGEALWRETMTLRFLRGADADADYAAIDASDDWDHCGTRRREAQERWFDDEAPSAVSGDTGVLDY